MLYCATLCYGVDKLLYIAVLCRITSGPFDQEVISSSLTLQDPDMQVRESTNFSDLISQVGK